MFKPYKYIKEDLPLKYVEETSEKIVIRLPKPKLPTVNFRKWTSVLLVGGGFFLITSQILLPWLATPPAQKPLLRPTVPQVLAETDRIVEFEFEFSELRQDTQIKEPDSSENIPEIFYLTIPKLGIERAEVGTNSENLSPDERLGHYHGSALPGKVGNVFIYGHSVLPMFFSPENYRTIFSTLDKLEEGDEVVVEFGGKTFSYIVEGWAIRSPEDVRPLEPPSPFALRQYHLTLMTCVPPGVGTNRLLVQAKLIL